MSTRLPSARHIRVLVYSCKGAHHWRVTQGHAKAQGRVEDREQAWACAIAGMLGAIRIGQLCDAAEGMKRA